MEYHDLVLSGKTTSLSIKNGDSAYNTLVRNGAKLRISAGGYVESTTVLNSTTVSNAGSAVSTFLSGGTMVLSKGAVADSVSVLRNARLTVSAGAVATDLYVSSGNVNAVAVGGDEVTLISGVNEKGEFFLSGGVASNFLMNSLGQLTVSKGAVARDTTIRFGGYLTVMSGGVATGIEQAAGGFVRADVYGSDPNTVVYGVNASGEFSLSGGVASNFILYDGGAQQIFSGGTALHTLVSGQRAFQYVWSGGVTSNTSIFKNGIANIYDGGIVRDVIISSGGSLVTNDGAIVSGATVMGALQIDSGNTGEGEYGGIAVVSDVTVLSGGILAVNKKATFSGAIDISGGLKIAAGIAVNGLSVSSGGSAMVAGDFVIAAGSSWNTTVDSGGKVTISSGGEGCGVTTVSGGGMLTVSGGGVAADIVQKENGRINATVLGGDTATLLAGSNGSGRFLLSNGSASGFIVYSGAVLTVSNGGSVTDAEVRRGGRINASGGAVIDGRLSLDFADLQSLTGLLSDISCVSSDARIVLAGVSAPGTYYLADSGTTEAVVYCMPSEFYENAVASGGSCTNAFAGRTYDFSTGRSLVVTEFEIGEAKATAGAITVDDTALNGNDRAAKWDAETDYTDSVTLANESLSGDVWLEIDGTDVSSALFGASGNYAHTVNIEAKSGEIRNLAAGAVNGGSVAGVKLILAGADLTGAAYAGGFGSVTDEVRTVIKAGTFAAGKDFYAGALANYKSTGVQTTVGDIILTIDGGTFGGNIYGASAVKASAAGAHAAGNVTLSITGGETTKGNQACIFAGGYATGTAADAKVYTVGDIDAAVSGGMWGEAANGRGFFGGAFASGVTAEARNVAVTIDGGTFGNVFGGGWAQKNGTSIVGDVDITISGGAFGNVFGGGGHSISGGATETGDVTITVTGGNITGAIYARGQIDGDTTGTATVIFTGANDCGCDVYGYSYVGGMNTGALLTFSAYTGSMTGSIGGFDSIELAGDTALALAPGEDKSISGNAWTFDVTERKTEFADAAMLEWSNADFSERTVTLDLNGDNATAWTLAAGISNYGAFDVQIDGTSILDNLIGLGDVIENTGTVCDGWGFTREYDALKFVKLA